MGKVYYVKSSGDGEFTVCVELSDGVRKPVRKQVADGFESRWEAVEYMQRLREEESVAEGKDFYLEEELV